MPKSSTHNDWLPAQALTALQALGANLAIARLRRKESLRSWAQRIGVSVRTVQRLEDGDPGVGMGVYAAALWLMARADALPALADPALDRGALELSLREARERVDRSAARSRRAATTTPRTNPRTSRAAAPKPR